LKTTQRGGIMRHFQTRYIHKQDFKLLVYRCFRRASTTRGRHSHEAHQAPQSPKSSSPLEEKANVIIEERCENSPQKRAKDNPPKAAKNPEPKWTPNPTSMCATLIKSRILNGPQSPTEWRRSSKLKKTAKMKKWMKLKEKLRGNRGSLRSHGGNLRKCMKFEEEYNI
jgi:hypothetical protein